MVRLNLGCGSNVKEDFINFDLEPQSPHVGRHDLRRPLPTGNDSVDLIFSEHFIEHVEAHELRLMLRDWFRVLRPGGWLRLSTPDLSALVANYLGGKIGAYAAVGWNPRTPCQMLNEGMRLWGHKFLYSTDELLNLLESAGFVNATREEPRCSMVEILRGHETRPDCGDLVVQAQKPKL